MHECEVRYGAMTQPGWQSRTASLNISDATGYCFKGRHLMQQRQHRIPHDVLLEAAWCGIAWILELCLKKPDWACKTHVMTPFLQFPSPATHPQGLAQ